MRIAAVLMLLVTSAACHTRVEAVPTQGKVDVDVAAQKKNGEDWSGDLRGTGNYAAVTGRATGQEKMGTLTVNVSVEGLTAGGTYPWHVHEGKCGSNGPIVGPASAYPPLTAGADGRATATANVQVDLNEARDYFVNVHLSPTELGTIVACGDFDD